MNCAFCNREVAKGAGYLFAKKDGTSFLFCSSKCRNNQMGLKRVGKKTAWVTRRGRSRKARAEEAAKAEKPAEKKEEKPKEAPKEEKKEGKPPEKKGKKPAEKK